MASAGVSRAQLATLEEASQRFYSRFVRVGAIGLGLLSAAVLLLGVVARDAPTIIVGILNIATYGVTYALTFRGDGKLGRRFFVYGFLVNAFGAALGISSTPEAVAAYAMIALLIITLTGFVLDRVDLLISVAASLALVGLFAAKRFQEPGSHLAATTLYIVLVGLLLIHSVAVWLFVTHARTNTRALHGYVGEVDRVMAHAERISKGDLTAQVEGDSDVSDTIRAMLEGLRGMVRRTRAAASAISAAARQISTMAHEQEQGAIEQASAVAQVHRTLSTLLEGSSHAAQSTDAVFQNVELTQRTSEVVAQRAAALSSHTKRISGLLELIKSIANKSEILALNAALEGARAGEAGRGFSLVASQMQRLAESVMGSVSDARALVEDVDTATAATLAATEESTRLSAKATGAARQISVALQQQRASTEQVAAAMQDIQQVTALVSTGSTEALTATSDLARLADELKLAIEGFRLGEAAA